ncbi:MULTISPECIES: DMT family transporter [Asticcacaulis]|uniref:DMT family transporter n=1 Tax=Asticcacaulis TaxID=76890 RepID=UPI001AE329EA|nr:MULTISPECIES: DMT family transporter [Asticcacaulis]MBP2157519.1 drug/metabolite transporter (DMT)-like permease [Asticcacaulis solisilvae]MDR6798564.1 drug/metabolite transporter (DMT)-like permease [Asticcacaulis sp. BE141]
MSAANVIKLLLLAAIWGASFLFLRIAAPVLGPVAVVTARLTLGAVFLLGVALIQRRSLDIRAHWKHFLILGFLNTAFPFILFAYAAQTLPASLLSILNSTAPIFGMVISAVWLRTAFTWKSGAGLALGVLGVAILVGLDTGNLTPAAGLAVGAGLLAALCYGLASAYAKQARSVDGFSNAHGSLWAAVLFILPVAPAYPPVHMPSMLVIFAVLGVGILCSGLAYLLYFDLIEKVGVGPALSVGFLIPVFGVLWGSLFLHEHIGVQTVLGGAVVLVGTALITGFDPRSLFRKPVTA